MMLKPSFKATSLAIATLGLLQAQAHAAPSEAQLDSIKLYSDVTIAKDTVTGWGPWTEFEPPAAGNPPLNLPPANGDLYRTLPQVGGVGELVGFGAFYTVINSGSPVSDNNANAVSLTGPGSAPTSASQLLPDTVQLRMNAITGVYPPPASITLTRQADGTYTNISQLEFTKLTLIASPDVQASATAAPVSFYQLISYISDGNASGEPTVQGVAHTGVIGFTTPINDIAALRLGNITATYNGNSLINQGGALAPMTMTVNFGQSAWSGTWNNGVDGANGAAGFSASGTITGAQFSSAPGSITALDSNNISGSVKGAFYGAQAAAVGGVADITKNNVHHVDPFIAVKQPVAVITPTPNVPLAGTTR